MTNPDRTPARTLSRRLPQPMSSTLPLRVTIQDLRAARYCLAGVRPWFRRHGLDWQAFLERGIDVERLRATGDALVEPVIAAAETRQGTTRTAEDAPARPASHAEAPDGRA